MEMPPNDFDRSGLIVLGSLALTSFMASFMVLLGHYLTVRNLVSLFVDTQWLVLISNLLLSDLILGFGFTFSFHWYQINNVSNSSAFCRAQGGIMNMASVCSGLFVLALALNTLFVVFKGKQVRPRTFFTGVVFIWIFSVILTIIGPIKFGKSFFGNVGNWCSIGPEYENERLTLQYLWIFIAQLGTILIYSGLGFFFTYRRFQTHRINGCSTLQRVRLTRASWVLLMYAAAHVLTTIPLAVSQMILMLGDSLRPKYLLTAACVFVSQGLVDAIIYTLTHKEVRKHLKTPLSPVIPSETSSSVHASPNAPSTPLGVRWIGEAQGGLPGDHGKNDWREPLSSSFNIRNSLTRQSSNVPEREKAIAVQRDISVEADAKTTIPTTPSASEMATTSPNPQVNKSKRASTAPSTYLDCYDEW